VNIWFLTLREKQWSQKVGREIKSDALRLISETGYRITQIIQRILVWKVRVFSLDNLIGRY
jgi:hypothetical protein